MPNVHSLFLFLTAIPIQSPESKQEVMYWKLKYFLLCHCFQHCAVLCKRLLRLCFGHYSVFLLTCLTEDMNRRLLESQKMFSRQQIF